MVAMLALCKVLKAGDAEALVPFVMAGSFYLLTLVVAHVLMLNLALAQFKEHR